MLLEIPRNGYTGETGEKECEKNDLAHKIDAATKSQLVKEEKLEKPTVEKAVVFISRTRVDQRQGILMCGKEKNKTCIVLGILCYAQYISKESIGGRTRKNIKSVCYK